MAFKARTERVGRLRARTLTRPALCLERARWATESYKETEADPAEIRRAKALSKLLNNMPIRIIDDELLVGSTTTKDVGAALLSELRHDWWEKELPHIADRPLDKFILQSEEDYNKLFKEIVPYWKGKTISEMWRARVPQEAFKLNRFYASMSHAETNMYNGHLPPNYETALTKGLKGIREEIDAQLVQVDYSSLEGYEKGQFLTAARIAVNAVVDFANRYADLAESLARNEKNDKRKAELEKITEICRWVPENPARTFQEALQSIWFVHIAFMNECWAYGLSWSRPDQYLYPYYTKDIKEGRLTKDEAMELISMLLLKTNDAVALQSADVVRRMTGFPMTATIMLGGVDKDGNDAVNELSYMFLEADRDVALSLEDVLVRINHNTPDAFVEKAVEIARDLKGKVKFFSDDTAIKMLLHDGKSIEQARNYAVCGCWELNTVGHTWDMMNGMFSLAGMLDLALNNGYSRVLDKQIGPKTGDAREFKSIDDIWEAYKKQCEWALNIFTTASSIDKYLFAEYTPYPFLSCFFDDCIEQGRDVIKLTRPDLVTTMAFVGAPNVGDSMAAIQKVVFENKKITMAQLLYALEKNFEGADDILHYLASAPKFGNDDDFVDYMVDKSIKIANDILVTYKNFRGVPYRSSLGGATASISFGSAVGALPDGRKAQESLSEGGISPHQGRNVSGPAATFRSVAKLDYNNFTTGTVLNMKLNPDAVKDKGKVKQLAALIRTYLETGGYHVQFNIVDAKMLREAQKNPEKYRDLLVRVATYSAYFVEIGPELQNDIIARTEFEQL